MHFSSAIALALAAAPFVVAAPVGSQKWAVSVYNNSFLLNDIANTLQRTDDGYPTGETGGDASADGSASGGLGLGGHGGAGAGLLGGLGLGGHGGAGGNAGAGLLGGGGLGLGGHGGAGAGLLGGLAGAGDAAGDIMGSAGADVQALGNAAGNLMGGLTAGIDGAAGLGGDVAGIGGAGGDLLGSLTAGMSSSIPSAHMIISLTSSRRWWSRPSRSGCWRWRRHHGRSWWRPWSWWRYVFLNSECSNNPFTDTLKMQAHRAPDRLALVVELRVALV
jgi:hypothetical protein